MHAEVLIQTKCFSSTENLLLAYRIRPKGQMLSFAGAKQALSKMNVRFDVSEAADLFMTS